MSITKVKIHNCKSIDNLELIFNNNLNCFIGKNNVGKSNIMKTIDFFYKNLQKEINDSSMFNKNNPYSQELEISVVYDYTPLLEKSKKNDEYNFFNENTNELFERIKKYGEKYCDIDNTITIVLKKYKNGKTVWNIDDYDFRTFMATRYPVYFLETRNIDLYNWESMWEVIGSITPFRQKIKIDNLKGVFQESENEDNYEEVINTISQVLIDCDVVLNKSTVFEKVSQIIQLQLEGKTFSHQFHSLSVGSYGMNSITYINVYLNIILKLFEKKHLASPMIMIDEPELHLHPKKIESFVKSIRRFSNFNEVRWIFTSHSPSFTKSIIVKTEAYNIFHVTNTPIYNRTFIKKVSGFTTQRKFKLISDKEANLFFSEACLFVEGDTELELFNNEHILYVFPSMNLFDIYSFNSQNDRLQLVNPNDKKTNIKYLVLLDMDKIINYKSSKKKFVLAGDSYLNVLKNDKSKKREKYHYTYKFRDTYSARKYLEDQINQNIYNIDSKGISIVEEKNKELLFLNIQNYMLKYNMFALETTVEGALININNYHVVYEWLLETIEQNIQLEVLYGSLETDLQKTAFLRVLFKGKTDWLHNDRELKNQNKEFHLLHEQIKDIRKNINSNFELIDKTSGWISIFINWFVEKYLDTDESPGSFANRKVFETNFPEMSNLIEHLEKMI